MFDKYHAQRIRVTIALGSLLISNRIQLASGQTELNKAETVGEDFRSLSLSSAGLRPAVPMVGSREEKPGFIREMVQLQWRAGDPIYAFVILPKDRPKPPVIIYLYSFPSDIDRFRNDKFCEFLVRQGSAAVGFVSALTGHRYHDRPMQEWFVSELPEALASSVHDVQMLLNYLVKRGDLDVTRVGMFGEGSGATIALLAAAVDFRLRAVDLVDPWGDWPNWLAKSTLVPDDERPTYLRTDFLQQIAPLEPTHWFGRVKAAVRLQYLSKLSVTPAAARERIAAAAPRQATIIPYQTAVARYQKDKLNFFDWINRQLTARDLGAGHAK